MRVSSLGEKELRSVATHAVLQRVRECFQLNMVRDLIFLIFLKNINNLKYTPVREHAWQRKIITASAIHWMTTLNVHRVPGAK
jgi:hypothetical protein